MTEHSSDNTIPRESRINTMLALMLGVAVLEFVSYRLLNNLGMYSREGTPGIWAASATFVMILTGVMATGLLAWVLSKLVSTSAIKGTWWRWTLLVMSPAYLLTMFWSIFVSLSSYILFASICGVLLSIGILSMVLIFQPIPGRIRRLMMLLWAVVYLATFGWMVIDFLQVNRWTHFGEIALGAYRIAEGLFLALPFYAYLALCFDSTDDLVRKLKTPHVPALGLALVIAGGTAWYLARHAGGSIVFKATNQLLLGVLYRTAGVTLHWPWAISFGVAALFMAVLTTCTLLIPYRNWKRSFHHRWAGTGVALIYLAGLQPFSVYQNAEMFLGFAMLCLSMGLRYPRVSPEALPPYQDFHELLEELDDSKIKTSKPSCLDRARTDSLRGTSDLRESILPDRKNCTVRHRLG